MHHFPSSALSEFVLETLRSSSLGLRGEMQHSHLLLPISDFLTKVLSLAGMAGVAGLAGPSPQFGLLNCSARYPPGQKPESGFALDI